MLKLYVKEYLDAIGQTPYWLSMQTRIAPNNIQRICNGETKNIRMDSLSKICDVLHCTPNDLIQDADKPFRGPQNISDKDSEQSQIYPDIALRNDNEKEPSLIFRLQDADYLKSDKTFFKIANQILKPIIKELVDQSIDEKLKALELGDAKK